MRTDHVKEMTGFARRLYEQGFSLLAFLVMLLAFGISGFDRQELRAATALPSSEARISDEWLTRQATRLSKDLRDQGIQNAAIYSRIKSLDSAREKAARKGIPVSELNDLYGMRVVVENELDVYHCLNTFAKPIPSSLAP